MSKRILVIEDNEQNMYLLRCLLEACGLEIVEAGDGLTGIEMAKRLQPAAILLDIQLPVMDGYSVARARREHKALDGVPIIAVTSYAMLGDREKILAAGATDYVEKPIDPDKFVERLRRHVQW
jgi:CheY-like chemotaxis protein